MKMNYFEIDVEDFYYLHGYIAYIPQTKQYLIYDKDEDWLYLVYAKDEIDALLEFGNWIAEYEEWQIQDITKRYITVAPSQNFNPDYFSITILG
ncbi:MAG: hypothetical protein K2M17_00950 [Bacilli bacterium]|nr:hypothetical protein [Bacilli bacterium]